MPGEYDARIKDLSVVEKGTSFTVDTLATAGDFDVLADIEVGASLNAVITRIQIWVSVGDLSQLTRVDLQTYDQPATPVNGPRSEQIRIPFNALTGVGEGDLLQAVATLKVTAGVLTDVSNARSEPFIFTA
ncbi:hypothetical protein OG889_44875 [Streptomyces sp. NBC_00481]|uniref:hypothetical protein n=1 Tax=Streptomyces sp. NBC_00481 TaxID=2975755 RepID=UPI002DDBB800|nr:hypothetical protein [Streptomyces sp. NBC_00481]WRZ01191.1 hypothetical protein OG889_44875 [Streptomyces sp. NBC_00481]